MGGFIPDTEDGRRDARRGGPRSQAMNLAVSTGSTVSTGSRGSRQLANRRVESSRPTAALSASANRCTECGTGVPCNDLYAAFGALICGSCRKDVPLISKSNAKQQYLVTDNDLLRLRWLERKNPQQASWTSMKLYLEREVQEVSYRKYGDQAGLEAEARRRVSKKLDKRVQEREDKARLEARRVKRVRELREGIARGVVEDVVAGDVEEI